MSALAWSEFEHRCQKPEHRLVGNWMARRIARPLALRVTWVVAPWGVSANAATLAAWACAAGAAAAFGWGSIAGWIVGAALLQLWYLLDHVDGQLARFHGAASLDGVQLDYLMHHTVNLLIPWGVGWGLFVRHAEPLWLLAGMGWGLGSLLLGLQNDARYKAFIQRLKRVRGELRVLGGGGSRPSAAPSPPRKLPGLVAWLARKSCEPHLVMNTLTLLSLGASLLDDRRLLAASVYLSFMAATSLTLAVGALVRSQRQSSVEREFALWYRPPDDHALIFENGWWVVAARTSFVQPEETPGAGRAIRPCQGTA
ncbi:MAG: phosphatidylglycerophosphate synthase [Planctomycetes bacterium]|nr:phosphatidylglycerophosphate synthase [Planctomycetota bacterium]